MNKKSKRAVIRRNRLALQFACRWLGIGSPPKKEAFAAAANAMGAPHPVTSDEGYDLLVRFQAEFRHATSPNPKFYEGVAFKAKRRVWDNANSDAFLLSFEWRQLRMKVLKARGARCECCGATARDGVRIHVDHIKPRRRYPELALNQANLQVLCEVCNHGKGSWDETDWRAASQPSSESSADSPVTRSGDGDGHAPVATFPRLLRKRRGSMDEREPKAI